MVGNSTLRASVTLAGGLWLILNPALTPNMNEDEETSYQIRIGNPLNELRLRPPQPERDQRLNRG